MNSNLDYLDDDFDAKKITISQICSILSKHNIDLPAAKQRKDFYVDLFNTAIFEKRREIRSDIENVKPSSQGIEVVGPVTANSKIPVLMSAKANSRSTKDENDENDENVASEVFVDEEVEEDARKPSLLTAIKLPVIGKRKSLDGKNHIDDFGSRDDQDRYEEGVAAPEPGKRVKMTERQSEVEEEVRVAEEQVAAAWTPRLAWKLGKPPTPMLLKTKMSMPKSIQDEEELLIEAPKQKRFNIQPQLPGVRQNLPPFSPQKVEHLKPVKELVAKFDDGVPVMPVVPGIPFPLSQEDGPDSDSTLSIAPDEYDDSFIIEKDDLKQVEYSVLEDKVESLFQKEDVVVEKQDDEATESEVVQEAKTQWSFFTLVRSLFSVMILLATAALIAWVINQAAAYSSSAASFSSLSSFASKVEAGLSFAYQHPYVALDLAKSWSQKELTNLGSELMKIEWNQMPAKVADYCKSILTETVLFYQQNFTPFAQNTIESLKSIDFESMKSQAVNQIKLADMHLQDVKEYLQEYTLPLSEKTFATFTQYSLIVRYEVSKIVQSFQNSSILKNLEIAGQQAMAISTQLAQSVEAFGTSQLKKIASEENWMLVMDLVREYPAPFGLDAKSFIALLFGTGMTFGVIGAFLILI